MRKRYRIAVYVLGGLAALGALMLLGAYLASQHVPAAYRRALAADPAAAAQASHEMVRDATDLINQVQKPGTWHARFTAEQINGWLAVDMPKNHPKLLPAEFSEPRVVIAAQQMTVYCRYRRGEATSVLSLAVDVYLAEPDVVALRIRRARAGLLPVPLDEVLSRISRAALRRNHPIQWKQSHGDPVALIPISLRAGEDHRALRLESLELAPGEIYLSGTTE